MKFKISTLLIFALLLVATSSLFAQRKGNGNVTKQDRSVSGFEGVNVGGAFDVYLQQGPFSVKVEADENLHEVIVTEVKNGKLHIHTSGRGIRKAEELNVYVTLPNLTSLSVSGAADVEGEGIFRTDRMSIGLSGASDVELLIDVDELDLSTSGASDISLGGSAQAADISMSGSSDLNATKMITQVMAISQSGSSDAHVHCEGAIEGSLSGSSDMYCAGKPAKHQIKTSGAATAVMQ